MSDSQIQRFIFKPGFSTAAKVTSVSGRGVGMDVVRTNIEKIGGTIELKSTSAGHDLHHQDPADPGHRFGPDRRAAASASPFRRSAWSNWSAPPPTAEHRRSSGSTAPRSCACATGCCRWSSCRPAAARRPGPMTAPRPSSSSPRSAPTPSASSSTGVFDTEEIVVKPVAPDPAQHRRCSPATRSWATAASS